MSHPELAKDADSAEKSIVSNTEPSRGEMEALDAIAIPHITNQMQRWSNKLSNLFGVEGRGIERVPEELRKEKTTVMDYIQMGLLTFAVNCQANSINIGILAPVAFGLGFTDSMICCLFGTIIGAMGPAYISSFGPMSGSRTLAIARFTMGYWPSRLCILLNLAITLGYGLVGSLTSGLILSAVNGGSMTPIVGVVIAALLTWFIALLGINWFHLFQRYTWIPQVCIFFIMVGVAGPSFNPKLQSQGSSVVITANRLSYVFLSAASPLGWSSIAADFYCYFPAKSSRWLVGTMTFSGLFFGKLFTEFIGIGLGSGISINSTWAEAFNISSGALIVKSLAPLGTFGSFCSVILALGVVANDVPCAYSAALSFQLLGHWARAIPRVLWVTFSVIVFAACAIAGRLYLLSIFQNFLALIGYWAIIWITLTAEEEVFFRRKRGYNWSGWDDPKVVPVGLAALAAFLVGWAGAILCMDQAYYVGVIAAMVGNGSDIGLPVAAAWAAIVYPPLRYLELKRFGR